MKLKRTDLLLYAITDGRENIYERAEKALFGGATVLQYREKRGGDLALAKELKKLCHRYGVPFLIDDSFPLALSCGADGVHVGKEDCSVESIRQKTGKDFIVGATAKTVEDAKNCYSQGADYLGSGACFPSPTKKDAILITFERLKEICSSVPIPVVAIGGITEENISSFKGCSVSGFAVISALFQGDIESRARRLRKLAEEIVYGI